MKPEVYNFEFDVYRKGYSILILNNAKCTHAQASLVIELLNLCKKEVLRSNDYFAYDYIR